MNKILITFFTLLFCLTSSVGWSADFQKGLAAAERGDFVTALREWTPLAEQGNTHAQFNLGVMYQNGQGVLQNYKTAVKWYRLSAEQGTAFAQYNLGQMYIRGDGVTQDDKTALKWYRLSAEQGDDFAQYNLSVMYGTGKGVIQDNIYAHMWANISASSGNKNGDKVRDIIAKKMTPADISTAQQLARECVEKKYKGC
tara:strand:- start:1546 stop:2139 length:594 start_codon:yes stop_codon:yes gene_type:complete